MICVPKTSNQKIFPYEHRFYFSQNIRLWPKLTVRFEMKQADILRKEIQALVLWIYLTSLVNPQT